jgi:hypothetical protein
MHDANSFLTLTYNSKNLPKDNSLDLKHFQDFCKRLRKRVGPFRYYHCGEYGDPAQGRRPHYHAIMFGLDFSSDRTLYQHTPRGDALYSSKMLNEVWGKGYCLIGAVTHESAAYVARYCMKKQGGDKSKAHYEHVNLDTGEVTQLKPEYATMSRRPGIGKPWLDKFRTDVYPQDFVVSEDGYQSRPPRFYDYVLDQVEPEQLKELKKERVKKGRKHRADNTYERLRVRETVKRSQLTQLHNTL